MLAPELRRRRPGLGLADGWFDPVAAVTSDRRPQGLQGRNGRLLHFGLVLSPRTVTEGVSHAAVGAAERALKLELNAVIVFSLHKELPQQGKG